MTSGTDGIYPRGFAIGRVAEVSPGVGLYLSIFVDPVVDFPKLEEVLVVVGTEPVTTPSAEDE